MSRTEQLGLPIPRKLIATKTEFYDILEEKKLHNLDSHLEKSLKTIYCKMIAQKAEEAEPKKKKGFCGKRKDKKRVASNSPNTSHKDDHEEWLLKISQPKKIFLPEVLERVKGNVDINRIARLSQPRHRPCPEGNWNVIPDATLNYVATERIVSLAQPKKEKLDDVIYGISRISFAIPPAYQSIKSKGIDELSRPSHPRTKYLKVNVDVRCSYYPISRGALQYEASNQILKLSKPKDIEEEEVSDPYKVKKKALKKLQKKQEKIFRKMSTPIEWKVTPKFEAK